MKGKAFFLPSFLCAFPQIDSTSSSSLGKYRGRSSHIRMYKIMIYSYIFPWRLFIGFWVSFISDRTVGTLIHLHFLQSPIAQPCSTLFFVEVLQKLQHTRICLEDAETDNGSALRIKLPFLWSTANWTTLPSSLECIKQASCLSAHCPGHNDRMTFPRFFYLFNHSFAQPRHNLVCKVKGMAKEWLYCSTYVMNTNE